MTTSNGKIGIIGLGVMGLSLARNMYSKGFSVIGYDTQPTSRQDANSHGLATTDTLPELIATLEPPRRILIMVPAGDPVDSVIREISPLLSSGDCVADGGNSHFKDTARRAAALDAQEIHYLGLGVSGGRRGALEGPGMMAGGSETAYALWKDVLESIAARFKGEPCVAYLGTEGAGHYVKMVHNGIEYGMMQVLAEAYALLQANGSHTQEEISAIIQAWDQGDLGGYLTAISADILSKKDTSGAFWIDSIKDSAKHKGTGTWTVHNSLELGIPVPGIDAALRQRQISAHSKSRHQIKEQARVITLSTEDTASLQENTIEKAVYAAQMLNYIQGFHLMAEARKTYGFSYRLSEVAAIWRNGCIISSKLITKLAQTDLDAYSHPLMAVASGRLISEHIEALRSVVSTAVLQGVSAPALSANLNYWDSFSNTELPTNLIQAQRDYFGGHGLELRSGEQTSLDWEGSTNRTPDSD